MSEEPEITIVEAVATASGRGGKEKSGLAQAIERAMSQAVTDAYEEGLANDPEKIKERMEAARARVRAEFKAG